MADPKNRFIAVKATEGQRATFASFVQQIAVVRGSASLPLAYHFAWLNQDPLLEAANFVNFAQIRSGEIPCLDIEDWGETNPSKPNYARDKAMRDATSWSQRLAYTLVWCAEVKRLTGATPLIYANWSYIKGLRTAATPAQWAELTSYCLWLAEPTGTAGKHSTVTSQDGKNPDCWPILLHQYAVDTLDRDYTPDIDALRKLAKP